MTTQAIASFGTLLKVGDGGSPEVFTTIAEVLDISGPEETTEVEDATNHGSPSGWEEVIPTIQSGGESNFEVNYIPAHATHDAITGLLADKRNKTLRNFKIVMPDVGNTEESFAAYVTKMGRTRNVKGKLIGSFTLRISGPIS